MSLWEACFPARGSFRLLIEDILYPDGRKLPPAGRATGMRLQTPRILGDDKLLVLRALSFEARKLDSPFRCSLSTTDFGHSSSTRSMTA